MITNAIIFRQQGRQRLSGITELLIGWNRGDKGALDRLMPLVYEELRNVARRHLANEGREHTLESAALVNETYFRHRQSMAI